MKTLTDTIGCSQPVTDSEVADAVEALLAAMRGLVEAERKADLMLAGKLICRDALPKEVDGSGSKV